MKEILDNDKVEHYFRLLLPYFFVVIGITTIFGSYVGYLEHQPYKMGDWLINYQSGFIRRGLMGELSYQLSIYSGINPGLFVFILQSFFYSSFFFFSYMILRKQKSILPYVILILSPFIFTFQLNDLGGGFRKEIIYFTILSIVAYSAIYHEVKKFNIIFYTFLLIYPVAILTHEMLAIFLPYIVSVYFIRHKTNKIKIIIFLLIPSIISFVLSIYIKSGIENMNIIFNSLAKVNYPVGEGAISWLDKNFKFAFELVMKKNVNLYTIIHFCITILISLIPFIPVFVYIKKILTNKKVALLILISVSSTVVLMLVAIDWGRFLYIHLVSMFILVLLYDYRENLNSKSINGYIISNKIKNSLLVFAFIFIYSLFWHIPHISGNSFVKKIYDINVFSIPKVYYKVFFKIYNQT